MQKEKKEKKYPLEVTANSTSSAEQNFVVYQPNRVTFGKYKFTLTQMKVVAYIMKSLQRLITPQVAVITKDRNQLGAIQLELFQKIDDKYFVDIPKALFVKSRNYEDFRNAVEEIASILVSYPTVNPTTNKLNTFKTHLFSVHTNDDLTTQGRESKSRFITIQIERETLRYLTLISIQEKDKSIYYIDNYTNFTYETLTSLKKLYSFFLYLYLCSWKNAGGWRVKIDELKAMLGLEKNEYSDYRDFKKRVLISAQIELKDKADIWFEFEKEGEYIYFKIITKEHQAVIDLKTQSIIDKLRVRFKCNDDDIKTLIPIISVPEYYLNISNVLQDVVAELEQKEKNKEKVTSLSGYVITSINNWHKNSLKKKMSASK